MDVAKIREDFPIFLRKARGKPLVYLDSAATSQKPRSVLDAERSFYERTNANVHRGVYELSEQATDAYEHARSRVARFVGASDASEIVFLRGVTEAINLVAHGLGETVLSRGDRVLTTVMEHHSNFVPWHFLRERRGISIDALDLDADGRLRLDELDRKLTKGTKVVALTAVSNVLGTVNDVARIAERAHEVGALVVVDAAQAAPHRPIDVAKLGADFLTFSGHKTLGPMGIGALWGRSELLERLPPFLGGGEMIREVHLDRVSYREPPARFEAGTPNAGGAVALSAALDYLERIGWEELRDHGLTLARRWFEATAERLPDRVTTFGPPLGPDREPILSFSLRGAHPHDIASLLDAHGIAVRAGHHCAQPLMERLKVPALTRASPYLYNTVEEIDATVSALVEVDALFSGTGPARAAAT